MLDAANAILLVVDVQEKLARVIYDRGLMVSNLKKLIAGMRVLEVPIIVTEQYARPVLPIVDYAFILENGAAVLEGTREEVINNPDVRSAYFGI